MKKIFLTMMAAALLVGLMACDGKRNSKEGIPAIQKLYDAMDEYWYQTRAQNTWEAIHGAWDVTNNYLKGNSDNLVFDIETDETTSAAKLSSFKFDQSPNLPSVRFWGQIILQTPNDLGDIHLHDFGDIPELSFVFYRDDLPIQKCGVVLNQRAMRNTDGQPLKLEVYGWIRFPDQGILPELRLINHVVLTKKRYEQKEMEAALDTLKARQLKAEGSVLFDKGILGPVQVGKPIPDLPKFIDGLYDKYQYQKIEHEDDEMDGPWTEEYYLFIKSGKEVFRANIDDNMVSSIVLLEGSSFIKTSDGIYVGSSARELFIKKRLRWDNYYEGTAFGRKGHYFYYVNSDDLIRTEIPHKAEDFKADAKVTGISYSNN